MSVDEVDKALGIIETIRARGVTILLIEHNMRAVMKLCDRIFVLNFGQKIAEGTPREVKQNQEVIRAYLGTCDYGAFMRGHFLPDEKNRRSHSFYTPESNP